MQERLLQKLKSLHDEVLCFIALEPENKPLQEAEFYIKSAIRELSGELEQDLDDFSDLDWDNIEIAEPIKKIKLAAPKVSKKQKVPKDLEPIITYPAPVNIPEVQVKKFKSRRW